MGDSAWIQMISGSISTKNFGRCFTKIKTTSDKNIYSNTLENSQIEKFYFVFSAISILRLTLKHHGYAALTSLGHLIRLSPFCPSGYSSCFSKNHDGNISTVQSGEKKAARLVLPGWQLLELHRTNTTFIFH